MTTDKKDFVEAFIEAAKKCHDDNTPLPGDICKKCGGEVVKEFASASRHGITYGTPKCKNCGQPYANAKNATPVGLTEIRRVCQMRFI